MEWTNRGASQSQSSNQSANPVAHAGGSPSGHNGKRSGFTDSHPKLSVALLFCVTILLVSVLFYAVVYGNKTTTAESKYVDSSKLQAVFLNGGQVYFGHILNLNDKYVRVGNIYYLRVNQQVQPNQSNSNSSNDVTLVKLGCELHGPEDQMLINRDQVVFWENLKSDGQVAKAVQDFIKANPDGQKCTTNTTTNSTSTKKP